VISFRYHVVSLVAVLLALAAGIVLGGGPLQRSAADEPAGGSDGEALEAAQRRIGQLEQAVGFGDSYARATAGELVAGALRGRAVTVVTLPGADDASVENVADVIGRAGGQVTARVTVGENLLDVGNRQLVSELATQVHDTAKAAVRVPAAASGYERMSLLLAHAVTTTRGRGASVDDAGDGILAGSASADLVTTRGDIDRRGGLVVVVTGKPYGSADDREGAGSILTTLVRALDARSGGVVVAGPVAAAAEDGLVAAVRDEPAAARAVSTVDVVDHTAGAVASVLALAEQRAGRSGHYGSALAADGAAPAAGGRQ
jgi:hypothetical protein